MNLLQSMYDSLGLAYQQNNLPKRDSAGTILDNTSGVSNSDTSLLDKRVLSKTQTSNKQNNVPTDLPISNRSTYVNTGYSNEANFKPNFKPNIQQAENINKAVGSSTPDTDSRKAVDRNLDEQGGKQIQATDKVNALLANKQQQQQQPVGTNTVLNNNNMGSDGLPSHMPQKDKDHITKAVTETHAEVMKAAEDPSMFERAANAMGISSETANKVYNSTASVLGRVDWLTMAVVAAASASTGSNATKAITNGLLRGIESRGRQNIEDNRLQQAKDKARNDEMHWDRTQAVSEMNAGSSFDRNTEIERSNRANEAIKEKKDLLTNKTILDTKDQAIVKQAFDSQSKYNIGAFSAAASYAKEKNMSMSVNSINAIIKSMEKAGKLESNIFSKGSLV